MGRQMRNVNRAWRTIYIMAMHLAFTFCEPKYLHMIIRFTDRCIYFHQSTGWGILYGVKLSKATDFLRLLNTLYDVIK